MKSRKSARMYCLSHLGPGASRYPKKVPYDMLGAAFEFLHLVGAGTKSTPHPKGTDAPVKSSPNCSVQGDKPSAPIVRLCMMRTYTSAMGHTQAGVPAAQTATLMSQMICKLVFSITLLL